jgi:hypothetical protein
LALLDLDEKYEEFSELGNSISYLATLTEKDLFGRYKEALKANHFMPFEEFSKPLEQMYLRMRLNLHSLEAPSLPAVPH